MPQRKSMMGIMNTHLIPLPKNPPALSRREAPTMGAFCRGATRPWHHPLWWEPHTCRPWE